MWKQILAASLLAGTLDISAAFIQAYLGHHITPATVLKYIASGIWGNQAFEGGYGVMAAALLFHFIIAFACTAVFFILYPKFSFLHYSHIANSAIIALTAWAVTHLVILPLSRAKRESLDMEKSAIAIAILVICIGLPVSFMARKYYSRTAA